MADFKSKYISELEKGKGLIGGAKSAASSSMDDFKKQFSKESIAKKIFGGDDILSALIRGKMGIKKETKIGKSPSESGGGLSEDAISVLNIIAKNSMSLPGMARDMNVMRQNIVKLVKLKGGETSRFGGKADLFFKTSKEREESLEAEMASKRKVPAKASASPTPASGGGGIGDIFTIIKDGLIQGAKFLFSPKNLLSILGKLALPLLIISTLFAGIKAGFEKYQETGSFTEAIVSGLGGMLSFLTFGLLGEDTLKQVFDSLSGVFQPVLDTVSNIFNSIKGFFKGVFGDTVDVKEVESGGAKAVTPKLPEGGKTGAPGLAGEAGKMGASVIGAPGLAGEAGKMGDVITSKVTEMGVPEGTIPKGIFSDLSNVVNAGAGGDFGAMISAGEELKKKYPAKAAPAAETPEQQAARNYELNKTLTSKVSGAIGIDLPMPAPPSPVMSSPPAAAGGSSGTAPLPVAKDKPAPDLAPAGSAGAPTPAAPPPPPPTPTAAAGGDKFAEKAESNKLGALQFLKRTLGILPDKDGVYLDMRNGEKKLSEEEVKQRISAAGKDPDKVLGLLKSVDGAGKIDLSSGNLNTITGGAIGGGGGGAPPAPSITPAAMTGEPPVSGASLSSASTDVAEAQRMESAADKGSVVNSPTTNSSSSSSGKPSTQTASAYDLDFAQRLATT
jgi:hypothetical protein